MDETFSNEPMKLSRLQEHLIKSHQNKVNKDITFLNHLKIKELTCFQSLQKILEMERASYNI